VPGKSITINRAPVLTLWGVVVARRLGHGERTALTLGKAMAGLNAQSKGRRLGIYTPPKLGHGEKPKKSGLGEEFWIELCGRPIPAKETEEGVRAVIKDQPIEPSKVESYLDKAFGGDLSEARSAMEELARAFKPKQLAEIAFSLYERFRPSVARGKAGWGQKGTLDLGRIRALAEDE
jgi:hypothetical protein